MTKSELLDRLHYVSGILAELILDGKVDAAKPFAVEVRDLNYRLNQIVPS